MQAVRLVKYEGWSIRKVSRYIGAAPSTISRWTKKDLSHGWRPIPTLSSRPKSHPRALNQKIVKAIIKQREKRHRCAEVVHRELQQAGINVSLSSVKRTLKRNHLLRERSPWKRLHRSIGRPLASKPGDLVQMDTIHLMKNYKERIYVYTLLDVHSRWAWAFADDRASCKRSLKFIKLAQRRFPFPINCLQSDHGSEFSQNFSERIKIAHRHSRVRKPNDNAHLERFNRTLQDELLKELPPDVSVINKQLPGYLKYYNEERLHMGINFKTPMQVLRSY
jgi:transposase InsO family protein